MSAGDLQGPDGQRIAADNIDILQVRYVRVVQPTDAVGTSGLWPDPLPPLTADFDVPAHQNSPLWIRVRVPKGQPAGRYHGQLSLQAEGIQESIPLDVEVFGFELPDRMTCTTAFGFDPSLIRQYHGLRTDEQRRQVLAQYFQCLADHHISPYDPAPDDPIRVTWKNVPAWSGGELDQQHPHAGTASLKLTDNSSTDNVSAQYERPIAIPPRGVKLSFWYRTGDAEQPFTVTLRHFDVAHHWMPGRNTDLSVKGSRQWQHFEQTIDQFPKEARTLRLDLRATVWQEDGTPQGTVWYDDVSLTDLATGQQLLTGGDFESAQQPAPHPEFDFTRWDRAMTRAIDQWHFNTFRLGVPGLGGGTFHARYEPELLGYGEDTPQYKAAMKAYLGQLQSHLRDKGWLDEAFVYWFDEPDPKDYEFVNNGFAKLKKLGAGRSSHVDRTGRTGIGRRSGHLVPVDRFLQRGTS